ncbi:MAG: hypothetical protein OHK0046_22830 [Anaerolineae bacterium]
MGVEWSLTREMSTVHLTQVFSGGACNILNEKGELVRNTERDRINDWLTSQRIIFFDPQVHPDTHGVEYDYDVHHPLEMAARGVARINLYEVSPKTFGGVSALEIASDHFQFEEPMVIYFSDGDPGSDSIPAHSPKGHPLFRPEGIFSNRDAMHAHYREFVKNASNMRKYVMRFAQQMDTLTVGFGEPARGDIVISPDRMHATDLFQAVVRAASKERVFITFTGGPNARDSKGNPLFLAPGNPPDMEMRALLDQYIDEGNQLRRMIAELIEISVFVRVVYTQVSVIQALGEVLKIRGII